MLHLPVVSSLYQPSGMISARLDLSCVSREMSTRSCSFLAGSIVGWTA